VTRQATFHPSFRPDHPLIRENDLTVIEITRAADDRFGLKGDDSAA
jgi:hypothetical protein